MADLCRVEDMTSVMQIIDMVEDKDCRSGEINQIAHIIHCRLTWDVVTLIRAGILWPILKTMQLEMVSYIAYLAYLFMNFCICHPLRDINFDLCAHGIHLYFTILEGAILVRTCKTSFIHVRIFIVRKCFMFLFPRWQDNVIVRQVELHAFLWPHSTMVPEESCRFSSSFYVHVLGLHTFMATEQVINYIASIWHRSSPVL